VHLQQLHHITLLQQQSMDSGSSNSIRDGTGTYCSPVTSKTMQLTQ
jgi:hypothetical protein